MTIGGMSPLSKPAGNRRQVLLGGSGMTLQDLPLLIGGFARFVEDLGGHVDLAHVVQQRRPPELAGILG